MRKTNKNANMGMPLGMCLGISIGTALGNSFGNMALGTSLGLCVGMAVGLFLGSKKDKEFNRQIEEEGYTIKDIKKNEQTEEYSITVVNRLEKECVVVISKGEMEDQSFVIGDIVFLDDDGLIEQAYDKEGDE